MKFSQLPVDSRKAIERAMHHWEQHWDWECPTLFGIELEQLQAARSACLNTESASDELVSLAALGALRELLRGASSVPRDAVFSTIGLSYEAANELCQQVLLCVDSSNS